MRRYINKSKESILIHGISCPESVSSIISIERPEKNRDLAGWLIDIYTGENVCTFVPGSEIFKWCPSLISFHHKIVKCIRDNNLNFKLVERYGNLYLINTSKPGWEAWCEKS